MLHLPVVMLHFVLTTVLQDISGMLLLLIVLLMPTVQDALLNTATFY